MRAPHVSPSAGALECAFGVDRLGFCERLSVCRLLGVGGRIFEDFFFMSKISLRIHVEVQGNVVC